MSAVYIPGNLGQKLSKLKENAPRAISSIAVAFFKNSFRNQGFTDTSLKKWEERKNGSDSGRAVLVKTGRLRNSIHTKKADSSIVLISASTPYAKAHNEGAKIDIPVTAKMKRFAWFKYYKTRDKMWIGLALTKKSKITVHIPQRKYMGNSYQLNRQIISWIQNQLKPY
jgi:phage gpG-like protein